MTIFLLNCVQAKNFVSYELNVDKIIDCFCIIRKIKSKWNTETINRETKKHNCKDIYFQINLFKKMRINFFATNLISENSCSLSSHYSYWSFGIKIEFNGEIFMIWY